MKKIIRFSGLTLNRDEQAVEPGELALCGGVELYDGALRPSVLDGTTLASGNALTGTMFFVHKTSSYTNFITKYQDQSNNWYMDYYHEQDAPGSTSKIWSGDHIPWNSPFSPAEIMDIDSIGNTLCILTTKGLFYFLYKNGSYIYLGQQPPFVELQFNLHVTDAVDTDNRDNHELTTDGDWCEDYGQIHTTYSVVESQRSTVTEQIMADINKRLADITADGYFYAPFFIRYAYRMFDGTSLIMHSPPVLLFPLFQHPVQTLSYGLSAMGSHMERYYLYVKKASLQIQCVDVSVIGDLSDWSDVIKSVDIFITPQVSRINTSKLIETCSQNYTDRNDTLTDGTLTIDRNNFLATYPNFAYYYSFDLPEYGEDEHIAHIKNSASFYKIRSYSISELQNLFNGSSRIFKDVEFDGSRLVALTAQQQMTDDYKTHNLLAAIDSNASLYTYNHRLNVHGIGEYLFTGFSSWVLFPYMGNGSEEATRVKVWVNAENNVRVMENDFSPNCPVYASYLDSGYVFYPDDRATHIELFYNSGGTEHFTARTLEPASFLNGAFSMGAEVSVQLPSAITDRFVPMINKIYTSKSDNPFYFPNLPGESGINSVGTGAIIGIAAVTRALSQGQVGDHDLVVFATDGIWVMKVSDQGTYSNMHNIAREVCVNKNSICQLDQSIIFATNRSLSQFRESDVVSISEVLDGPIRSFATLLASIRTSDEVAQRLIDFGTPATTLFTTGKVLYDYTSSRLIVFPANTSAASVAMVYSIRDKAWSTMAISAIKAALPGYPCPYIQFGDGTVKCLDSPYTYSALSSVTTGIVMSRTLTFSDTMDVIRGFRQLTDAATMPQILFFGSNDQRSWQQIGSSSRAFHNYIPGHPFRFFRFALYTRMHTDEKYQEVLLEVINKYAKL